MSVPSWTSFSTPGADASIGPADQCAFSSRASMGISLAPLSPSNHEAGLQNRGIGGAGFAFVGGALYTFEAYVWPDRDCTMFAELYDSVRGVVLARNTFEVHATGPAWGSTWVRYNVTLIPSAGTDCVGIPFGPHAFPVCANDRSAHIQAPILPSTAETTPAPRMCVCAAAVRSASASSGRRR
jgi:hypothetical protein